MTACSLPVMAFTCMSAGKTTTNDVHHHGDNASIPNPTHRVPVLPRSPMLRKRVRFERGFCMACGMRGLDLRGPTSYVVSLHGARQCNDHSLGQVRVRRTVFRVFRIDLNRSIFQLQV